MRSIIIRRPSAATLMAAVALAFSLTGVAAAGVNLVNGNSLIARHSLSGNRLVNHTLTGTQINLNQLGVVPRAFVAGSASNAVNAQDAAHVTGYYNSGLITMSASSTAPGNQQVITTDGPFSFLAECLVTGSTVTGTMLVQDNTAKGAVEEDYGSANSAAPALLGPGDMHTVFAGAPSASAWWRGGAANSFAVAAPSAASIVGTGAVGENVLGAGCSFQLVLFG